ncbi:MAG TPA: M20/M25/M40 family metallo-hydrolase [Bryobacteraceae bacterium]|nr:M20/M25/M40 family metallo-hydrolase [Bryobacteraceae bacterium]HPT24786.1 M20/M25/M40 family metallo-hydrolase [Bryobacteraceae bacterium]
MTKVLRYIACAVAITVAAGAQERVDLDTIYKIKQEAIQNSKVMDHLFYLTEVNGQRLTGSPGYKKAAEWVVKQLQDMGLKNARLEKWGPFGRTWENQRFSAHMVEPNYQPLIGFPLAWSKSTEGVVTGEPVIAVIRTEEDMVKFKGQLKGKIVLSEAPREIQLLDKPFSSRYTDKELEEIAAAPDPNARMFGGPRAGGPGNFMQQMALRKKIAAFWAEEAPAALVQSGYRNDGGTIAASSAGNRDPSMPLAPATIALTPEHYNRIYRLLDKKIPVKLELEVRNQIGDTNDDSYNVVADLPGTGKHKDEVVIIGGHLDSWHGGTGATDNAAGSAVMMEAIRVLTTLKLPLDRTVRIALWSGEEQGLLGSRAYVKEHFADPATMKTTEAWDKLSAYYNIDNGAGKIRGIYLQGNEAARPVFEALLAPFKDMGAATVTIKNTSGTDHQAFDAVGLPGFQFIQDPLEYSTRTHHSNMDVYDRVQRGDMIQMSTIMTSLVYHTANRDQKIPRKTKPEPRPAGRGPMGF